MEPLFFLLLAKKCLISTIPVTGWVGGWLNKHTIKAVQFLLSVGSNLSWAWQGFSLKHRYKQTTHQGMCKSQIYKIGKYEYKPLKAHIYFLFINNLHGPSLGKASKKGTNLGHCPNRWGRGSDTLNFDVPTSFSVLTSRLSQIDQSASIHQKSQEIFS